MPGHPPLELELELEVDVEEVDEVDVEVVLDELVDPSPPAPDELEWPDELDDGFSIGSYWRAKVSFVVPRAQPLIAAVHHSVAAPRAAKLAIFMMLSSKAKKTAQATRDAPRRAAIPRCEGPSEQRSASVRPA